MQTTSETGAALIADLASKPRDGNRYDVIDGELICMPPAWPWSSRAGMRVGARLLYFVEAHRLPFEAFGADAGFILPTGDLVSPDAAVVLKSKLPPDHPKGFWPLVPDLAVEVVSPSDSYTDTRRKAEAYVRAGVPVVWVLDPRTRGATVYTADGQTRTLRFEAGDALDGGEVLPGFRLPLADVFAP